MRDYEDKYIELLLKRCIHFKKSNALMIHIDLKEHMKFAKRVEKVARDMGVEDICIHLNDLDDIHEYLKKTNLEDIKLNSLIDRYDWDFYSSKGGACLFLTSTVPGLMDDIDEAKLQKWLTLRNASSPYYRRHVKEYIFPWCIASLPNRRWAKTIFGNDSAAYDKLYLNIIKMVMADRDDPVKAWQNWIDKNNYYKEELNKLEITSMHYKNSIGTDLIVGIPKGNIWLNLNKTDDMGNPIIVNMPSYEIFNTPNKYMTNGIVKSSKPLYYNDCLIDNFYLGFKEGKVISCGAEVGQKVLETFIRGNPGANYLGEVALVPKDSLIANTGIVFNETLFDENSSCHFALGAATARNIPNYYDMTDTDLDKIGFNSSMIHVDFMVGTDDLSIEADTNKGKVLIFKNGNFNI